MIFDYHGPKTRRGWESYAAWADSLAEILRGWESYAAAYEASYGNAIGTDRVLGPAWAKCGLAVKGLLDGDCGGLDCDGAARNILAALDAQGFKHDGFTLEADERPTNTQPTGGQCNDS